MLGSVLNSGEMLGSVPNSAKVLGRHLLNSANAGQMPAEFSKMLGR